MRSSIKILTVITVLNLLATASIGWWSYTKHSNSVDVGNLEDLLEELSENNPHFLISLLNEAANKSVEYDEEILQKNVFKKREDILKAGFLVKDHQTTEQKTLVVFADLVDSQSLMYLKNVQTVLKSLNCSVRIIPISMFGEKATTQAKLITATAMQSTEKAFQLAIAYNPIEGAENDTMLNAEKLGLDIKKISNDMQTISETVNTQTKMADDLAIPGVPCIFLLTNDSAHLLPPVEAADLSNLIEYVS